MSTTSNPMSSLKRKTDSGKWRRVGKLMMNLNVVDKYRQQRLSRHYDVGLALSGGGLRSAMFCSGVLRALLRNNVHLDCVSSVSGGGYVAASYVDWKCRNGKKDDPQWHSKYFENMLERAPNTYARFNESIFRGLFDLFVQFVLVVLNCIGLSVVSTAAYFLVPAIVLNGMCGNYLRERFTTDRENLDIAAVGISWPELNLIVTLMMVSIFANFIRAKLKSLRSDFNTALKFHSLTTLMFILSLYPAVLAHACFMEVTYLVVAHGGEGDGLALSVGLGFIRALALILFVLLWLAFPGSMARRRAVLLSFLFLQAYIVQLRIFDYYNNEFVKDILDMVIWPAAGIILLVPLSQPLHDALLFHLYRWGQSAALIQNR